MPRIACGHCGGTHESVAAVKVCAAGEQGVFDSPAPASSSTTNREPLPVDPERLAGPQCLGRNVLVRSGHPIPDAWADCPRLTIDPTSGPDTLDELEQAWRNREPLAIEWAGGELPRPRSRPRPFHELDPSSEIENDRLHFLLTANSVNLLGPDAVFAPLELAREQGVAWRPEHPGPGDIELPDGSAAFLDGGPLDLGLASRSDLDGVGLIPRCHLLAGSLRPLMVRAGDETGDGSGEARPASSMIELADDQQAAVLHSGGPARILAPAGSGKTRVLTERVRYLVDQRGLAPSALTLVAYNRRAKSEMADRLVDLDRARPDAIRTLNSLALAIATGRSGFVGGTPATTIDEREVRRILGRFVPSKRRRQLSDPLEPWIDALSMCRLGLRHPDEVAQTFGGDLDDVATVLERYRQHLADNQLLDFDEQILRAVELLAGDDRAREAARRQTPVLLIDEFQDLTPAHLLLVRLLAGPACEVYAVGDDDQTIYGYSGASPRWLVDFDQYFPGSEDYFLTVNYRCPPEVIAAAGNLLSHNRHRVTKTIVAPARDPVGDSDRPDPLTVYRTGDPHENMVAHIGLLVSAGVDLDDIALLARVNAALLPALVFLQESGVPVRRPAGVDVSMLDRSGSGAALAWLRLATTPANELAADDLRLALRRPPRSLHPRIVDWVCEQSSVSRLQKLADRLNTERDQASVQGLVDDLTALRDRFEHGPARGGDTESLLAYILNDIGLLGAATQLDGSQRTARRAAHSDELLALLAVARLHNDPVTFERWLRGRFQDAIAPEPGHGSGQPAAAVGGNEPAVTLATVHATKGLEWPHVVVHDVRDGLYPHRLAEDPEEERRIFHVAITRARESVALTCSGPRSGFVDELETERTEPWPAAEVAAVPATPTAAKAGRTTPSAAKTKRPEPKTESEAKMRAALTEWRRTRAKADGVPAYVVLNNRTLDGIASDAPQSLSELGNVAGIGPSRLDQYGDEILGIVAECL